MSWLGNQENGYTIPRGRYKYLKWQANVSGGGVRGSDNEQMYGKSLEFCVRKADMSMDVIFFD